MGISSYGPELTAEAVEFMEDEGCPLLIHQPSYSILNRWIERLGEDGESLLDVTGRSGLGVIGFGPLAQGMLTDRYIDGIPADSRAAQDKTLEKGWLNEENLSMIRDPQRYCA